MKRFLITLSILLTACVIDSCGPAKSVSYTHRPFSAEGCTVSYSIVRQENELSIIATVKSDRLVFSAKPLMTLWNFRGDIMRIEGYNLQARSESSGIIVSNIVIPITGVSAMASFPVPQEHISFFQSGIQKVRLSTVPIVHEKTFSYDEIGEFLWTELNNANSEQY